MTVDHNSGRVARIQHKTLPTHELLTWSMLTLQRMGHTKMFIRLCLKAHCRIDRILCNLEKFFLLLLFILWLFILKWPPTDFYHFIESNCAFVVLCVNAPWLRWLRCSLTVVVGVNSSSSSKTNVYCFICRKSRDNFVYRVAHMQWRFTTLLLNHSPSEWTHGKIQHIFGSDMAFGHRKTEVRAFRHNFMQNIVGLSKALGLLMAEVDIMPHFGITCLMNNAPYMCSFRSNLTSGQKRLITTDFDEVRLSVISCEFHLLYHKSTGLCLSLLIYHSSHLISTSIHLFFASENILSLFRPLRDKDRKKSISLHMSENVPAYLSSSDWKI